MSDLEYEGCQALENGNCRLFFCYTINRRPYLLFTFIAPEAVALYEDAIEIALWDIQRQMQKLSGEHR